MKKAEKIFNRILFIVTLVFIMSMMIGLAVLKPQQASSAPPNQSACKWQGGDCVFSYDDNLKCSPGYMPAFNCEAVQTRQECELHTTPLACRATIGTPPSQNSGSAACEFKNDTCDYKTLECGNGYLPYIKCDQIITEGECNYHSTPENCRSTGGTQENAQEGFVTCGGQGEAPCTVGDFLAMVHKVIEFAIYKLAPLFVVIMIVIGGFFYLTSAGNSSQTSKGKSFIKNAVIGYTIVLSAWLIVNIILTAIGVAQWTGLNNWWEITL